MMETVQASVRIDPRKPGVGSIKGLGRPTVAFQTRALKNGAGNLIIGSSGKGFPCAVLSAARKV
jgi:hypothetical protein